MSLTLTTTPRSRGRPTTRMHARTDGNSMPTATLMIITDTGPAAQHDNDEIDDAVAGARS